MKEVLTVTEAKAQLSSLLERVLAGEEVVIGRAGKPVARLIAYDVKKEWRTPGAMRGQIQIAQDFDELPDDLAQAFGVK